MVSHPSISILQHNTEILSKRVITQVLYLIPVLVYGLVYFNNLEYKEAFALFDKKGTGAVPRETLGDLLRALGQNPTQAEVSEIVAGAPRDGEGSSHKSDINRSAD